MPRPFLLLAARPEEDAAAAEYLSMLRSTGLTAATLVHHRLDITPLGDLDLSQYAGILVGGSPFDVTTPTKTALQLRVEGDLTRVAREALDGGTPTLFTCYSIGLVTRLLGGTVDTEHGEDAAPVTIRVTDAAASDPLLAHLPREFTALVGHKESTGVLPEGAVLLAGSETCPVQMYRVGDRLWATQFHPEVTGDDFAARAVIYQHHGYFTQAELDIVSQRLRGAEVTEPARILHRFVELHA